MEVIFRATQQQMPPAKDEVYLVLREPEFTDRLDVASALLVGGLSVLQQGSEPKKRLVVPCGGTDPSLDTMLAASIALAMLAREELPKGLDLFARYTAMVREGLLPSSLPEEKTIEAIFLALRTDAGDDLSQPEVGRRFLAGWERLASAIWKAAADTVDPFKTAFLDDNEEFVRERSFLREDREVFGTDVDRGERWEISLPNGPRKGYALLLRDPKSLLFKHWSRGSGDASAGMSYVFLAVAWGAGQWVFSTDPAQRLSLKSLADRLQEAEAALAPQSAASDPWFDGARFHHTLIASPRGNSRLSEAAVLKIVRQWTHARRIAKRSARAWLVPAACCASLLALIVGLHEYRQWTPDNFVSPEPPQKGLVLAPDQQPLVAVRKGMDHAFLFGTNEYVHHQARRGFPTLNNAVDDARALAEELKNVYAFDTQFYANCSQQQMMSVLKSISHQHFADGEQVLLFFSGHGMFDPATRQGYIVPTDGDPENLDGSCIPYGTLKTMADGYDCKHVLVLLDVCHAGTFDEAVATKGGPEIYGAVSAPELVQRKLRFMTRQYLTSGGNVEVSDGQKGAHSPFMFKVLEALDSHAGEKILSFQRLCAEVETVSSATPQAGYFSRHDPRGDFLFVPKGQKDEGRNTSNGTAAH